MMLTRDVMQKIAEDIYMTNKAYEKKDKQINDEHYKAFREELAILELNHVNVEIHETWEHGLVALEVKIEEVKY